MSLFDDMDPAKLMFGENAIMIPGVLKVQDMGPNLSIIVGYSQSIKPRFGSKLTHQLVVCDMVIRPQLVMESSRFAGYGSSGLLTQSPEEWVGDKVIVNPYGLDEKNPIAAYNEFVRKGRII